MQLLLKKRYYPVNTGFSTAIKYRLKYGKSIFDINESENSDYIKNLINLLYVAIEGRKPPLAVLTEEAEKHESHILPFCVKLCDEFFKKDKVFEKYEKKIKSGKKSEMNAEDFDELAILQMFSETSLPEWLLDYASVYQVLGLYFDNITRNYNGGKQSGYKEMSTNEIKAFYGVN